MKNSSAWQRGFTLVELIVILVILGIVAAMSTDFLVTVTQAYSGTEKRAKLVARGRLAIEQMTRQLRLALPNALRVSASGNCIEFMPVVGGANYLQRLPDRENAAAPVSVIALSPFNLGLGSAVHIAVAPLFTTEVYTFAVPAARATIDAVTSVPTASISLTAGHRFVRNSINRRLFITDQPKRFCVSSGNLVEYANYGLLTSSPTDADPGGSRSLIAPGTSANGVAFSLSAASENRNMAVDIALSFRDRGEQVNLHNTVLVRNVP